MATIDSLPNETLSHIMTMLKEPTILSWDNVSTQEVGHYDALRAAALVCRRWRDPAQRALHESVSIPGLAFHAMGHLFVESLARQRYQTRELHIGTLDSTDAWLSVARACVGLAALTLLDYDLTAADSRTRSNAFADPCFIGAWLYPAYPQILSN